MSNGRVPYLAVECWGAAMNNNENAAYYFNRAEQEEASANATSNLLAASIHLGLADRYRAKASECEDGQILKLIRP